MGNSKTKVKLTADEEKLEKTVKMQEKSVQIGGEIHIKFLVQPGKANVTKSQ